MLVPEHVFALEKTSVFQFLGRRHAATGLGQRELVDPPALEIERGVDQRNVLVVQRQAVTHAALISADAGGVEHAFGQGHRGPDSQALGNAARGRGGRDMLDDAHAMGRALVDRVEVAAVERAPGVVGPVEVVHGRQGPQSLLRLGMLAHDGRIAVGGRQRGVQEGIGAHVDAAGDGAGVKVAVLLGGVEALGFLDSQFARLVGIVVFFDVEALAAVLMRIVRIFARGLRVEDMLTVLRTFGVCFGGLSGFLSVEQIRDMGTGLVLAVQGIGTDFIVGQFFLGLTDALVFHIEASVFPGVFGVFVVALVLTISEHVGVLVLGLGGVVVRLGFACHDDNPFSENAMLYLGIDPGKAGGWALLDDSGYCVEAAPMNLADLRNFASAVGQADVIGLERAQAAKDQGHQFEYGRGFGRLEGVIMAIKGENGLLGINYLAPAFWKARMGCPADKFGAVKLARRLMPELFIYENRLGNVPDGIAEAALMARCVMDDWTVKKVAANREKRAQLKSRKRVSYRD